jgi:anti-sigma factor RsiW
MTDAREIACNEFVELVTAFLDGALEPAAEARFVDHLAGCDGCDTYLDQMRRTIRAAADLPAVGMSGDARERLLAAFRDRRG